MAENSIRITSLAFTDDNFIEIVYEELRESRTWGNTLRALRVDSTHVGAETKQLIEDIRDFIDACTTKLRASEA